MAVSKPTFLALLLICCLHGIKAMGLCDFADKFPCEDNEGFVCFKCPGCNGHNQRKGQTTQDNTQKKEVTTEHATSDVSTSPKTTVNLITLCPPNMVYANVTTCQRTCSDPKGCITNCTEPEICICADGFLLKEGDCVPEEECGCFIEEEGIISEGESYVYVNCTKRGVCNNGQLVWDDTYSCTSNEVCEERNDVLQCYNANAMDCFDVYNAGFSDSSVYTILPKNWPGPPFQVYCNMTDGGGWTVFQRRVDGSFDFFQNWINYKEGFGSPDHEFWIGNEKLYYLTNQKRYTMKIDFVNSVGSAYYAEYDFFRINDESDNYRLSQLGTYSGTSGDSLNYHLNMEFSTYDQDHDACNDNCAMGSHGAWWYNCCQYSNLNGRYETSSLDHIRWYYLNESRSSKYVEMKIRPFRAHLCGTNGRS